MLVALVAGHTLFDAHFPAGAAADEVRRWLLPMLAHGPRHFVRNVACDLHALMGPDFVLPVSVTGGRVAGNSYVVSPYAHYVSYLEEELRLVSNPAVRRLLAAAVDGLAVLLRRGDIDRVAIVNNWLLSTNLYPALTAENLRQITSCMTATFPEHALMFRSLNPRTTPALIAQLGALGYAPIVSRRVHLFDARDAALFRRKAFRRDHALIAQQGYRAQHLVHVTPADAERIAALYGALYLEKYSQLNPAFTPAFVEAAVHHGWLEVHVLRHGARIDGVLGFFAREGVMTTPLLGYDTALPKERGLYRMLTALLSVLARDRGLLLHRSSGAATFKRARGALPEFEYAYVYTRHLPTLRRAVWGMLSAVTLGLGKPLLARYDR
ncbi:MAG: hypothetical protein RL385_1575 [Pseudomonadota bacterium]|jgi:hypothetical protein